MKPINAIAIGIFGVIAGYFVAIALLIGLQFPFDFLFDKNIEDVLGEPEGMIAFIVIVSLLCGPLAIYLCISIPRLIRWWLRRAQDQYRLCQNCKYDLHGSRLTRCPECGKPVPLEQRRRLAHIESPHA